MVNALRSFQILALVALCMVLWDAHLFLGEARATLKLAVPVMGNLNAAAQQGAQAVAKFNAAADAETAKLQATTEEARKTARAFRAGIDSLRQVFIDVHQQVIPQLTETVGHADANQAKITEATLGTIHDLKPSLENMAIASAAAAKDLSDPAIPESVANVKRATAGVAGMAEDGHTATTLAVEKERQLLKPARMAKTVGVFLLDLGWKVRAFLGL